MAVYNEGRAATSKMVELNKKKLPIDLVSAYNKVYMGYLTVFL